MKLNKIKTRKVEDTEDYMEHEHFEDIILPERGNPDYTLNQEDDLIIHNMYEDETTEDFNPALG